MQLVHFVTETVMFSNVTDAVDSPYKYKIFTRL